MTYEELLFDLISQDKKYIVMTAENKAAIRNLPTKIPNNFIDVGIAEQALVGIAAGLGLCKKVPIVHALAAFLTMRAFEFIRTDVGIAQIPVKLVGSIAGILSDLNGPTHQAVEDLALMKTIPGMQTFIPADEDDMLVQLPLFLKSNMPCYIRFNNLPAVIKHQPLPMGIAEVFGNGNDIAIIVVGALFEQAYKAKDILEEKGLSIRLINLRSLNPLDISTLGKTFKECKTIITVEDHYIYGGLYSTVLELAAKYEYNVKPLPIALNKKFFTAGKMNHVLQAESLSANQIAERIETHYNNKKGHYYAEWSSVQ